MNRASDSPSGSMAAAQLCVIVCTHDRADVLRLCLASLQAQSLEPHRFEVLLVDNRSTDDTAAVIAEFLARMPNLRAIGESRLGLSHARNASLQATQACYVAFLDDDAEAGVDWCTSILAAFSTVHPQPVSVGGPVLARYESTPPPWFPPDMDNYWRGERGHFVDRMSVFWGCNMAFVRTAVLAAGCFDVSLGLQGKRLVTGEDTALGWRIYESSPYFWYEPGAAVRHLTQASRMTLGYRLRRSFAEGRAWASIHDARWLSMRALRAAGRRLRALTGTARAQTTGRSPALPVESPPQNTPSISAAGSTPQRSLQQTMFLSLYRGVATTGKLLATRWW